MADAGTTRETLLTKSITTRKLLYELETSMANLMFRNKVSEEPKSDKVTINESTAENNVLDEIANNIDASNIHIQKLIELWYGEVAHKVM